MCRAKRWANGTLLKGRSELYGKFEEWSFPMALQFQTPDLPFTNVLTNYIVLFIIRV